VVSDEPVDVVVVGAGAAGSIYADVLARAGRRVRVIERGPQRELSDLVSSQLWARRLKWGAPPPRFAGDRPGFSHNVQLGEGLGGAALHHYATWPRIPEAALRARERLGAGVDWPFGYDELRPWYDALEAEAGLSGDAAAERWRPPAPPYKMPPLPATKQGAVLARGFKALGLAVAPLPVAITSREYRDRPACQLDGWCDAGCPIQALWNPLVLHVPRAIAAGARFDTGLAVTRIRAAVHDRAAGVEYVSVGGGAGRFQPAKVVVLAANLIQNPRLLLASRCAAWPEGAGNGRDQVGRHLMMEGMVLTYGLFAEPTEPWAGVSAGSLLNRSVGERPGAPPGAWQWQIAPAAKPNDIFGVAMTRPDLFGPALDRFIRRASTHLGSMAAMVEQAADPANRVTLAEETDAHGVPQARVEHRRGAALETLAAFVEAEGLRVMRAAGAVEAWSAPLQTGHLAGGTIMGTDPAHSTCDAQARVHGVPNLLVGGSGLFPANGGVSPTFTLSALALRSATHMARNWSEYA
jgi:choline dehydrogenase-like flavoprotein